MRYASVIGKKSQKIVGSWMLTCSGMVFIAVALGTTSYAVFYLFIRQVVKVVVDESYGK